jgi:hypothetical protein
MIPLRGTVACCGGGEEGGIDARDTVAPAPAVNAELNESLGSGGTFSSWSCCGVALREERAETAETLEVGANTCGLGVLVIDVDAAKEMDAVLVEMLLVLLVLLLLQLVLNDAISSEEVSSLSSSNELDCAVTFEDLKIAVAVAVAVVVVVEAAASTTKTSSGKM